MTGISEGLSQGFTNPALQAQRVFRHVLEAMARPGRLHELDDDLPIAPAALHEASFAIALALLDFETPIWLDATLSKASVIEALAFHCGSPMVERSDAASFGLIGDPKAMPPLSAFNLGPPDYPDRSATLILQLDGFRGGEELTLSGPGIQGEATVWASGLPDDFQEQWRINQSGYPNGVDLILTHGRTLACLPRTTRLGG